MKTKYVLMNTETREEQGVAVIESTTAEMENGKLSAACSRLRWFLPEEIEGQEAHANEIERNDNPYARRAGGKVWIDLPENPKAKAWDDGWLTAFNIAQHREMEENL